MIKTMITYRPLNLRVLKGINKKRFSGISESKFKSLMLICLEIGF